MNHEWRALIQYRLTDEEARQMIEGYGHPEVDYAPIGMIAAGEKPPVGDPRVFLGTHNMLREDAMVVCWNCEQAWSREIASKPCSNDSPLVGTPPLGNVPTERMTPVGRNELCPCGSGKKFKRCHGAN